MTATALQQILEHGWDAPATVGTFKASTPYTLAIPATPAERYRIRIEHVETTGRALPAAVAARHRTYANIPQANTFTHTQAATYAFTRASPPTAPPRSRSRTRSARR
jgi:hypothetical protein